MPPHIFFETVDSYFTLFAVSTTVFAIILYLSVNKIALIGFLDIFHFYWMFTFSVGYGVIFSLFMIGDISANLVFIIYSYGIFFVLSMHFFYRRNPLSFSPNKIKRLVCLQGGTKISVFVIFLLYAILACLIITEAGFGALAEENRFEQNRGYGYLIRLAEPLRIFIICYIGIFIISRHKKRVSNLWLYVSLFIILIFSSMINGAKFAFLESIYSIIIAIYVRGYFVNRIRIKKLFFVSIVLLFSISFAFFILSLNIENGKIENLKYIDFSFVLEKFYMRIVGGNANNYYMSLPNQVIDDLQKDNFLTRFLVPIVGRNTLSYLLEYDVSDYNVGRQILLYWDPYRTIAGGPTSHFDLFSYVYLGYWFGFCWIAVTAFILTSIIKIAKNKTGDSFFAAFITTLYVKSFAILLEPSIGFAYIVDVFFVFFLVKSIAVIMLHGKE
jgi:hypothetical protein